MINETQFSSILYHNNNNSNNGNGNITNFKKFKNNKTLFGSPLKKFINNIYTKLNIPEESFIISLFYLKKFYMLNKNNSNIINDFFQNIKIYVFTSIIISLKTLLDYRFNIKQMTITCNIKYQDYIDTELNILKGLNWNMNYDTQEYYELKRLLEHHMD